MADNLPISEHFTLIQVADGVYQALAADEGGAFGNAGIIDLGDEILLFDSFVTPQAARDLYSAAQALTGRNPTHLLLSHAHVDHYQGACGLPDTIQIISTSANQQALRKISAAQNADNLETAVQQTEGFITTLKNRLNQTSDPAEAYDLRFQISYLQQLLVAASDIQTRIPNLTFEEQVIFEGPKRKAIGLTYGGGHSPSDVMLYLPDEGIVFTGDIVAVHRHAFLGAGNIPDWLIYLDKLEALNAHKLIPGHGPIGGLDAIAAMRSYLTIMSGIVEDFIKHGGTSDWLGTISMPEQFKAWGFGSWLFNTNLNILFQQSQSAQND